MPELVSQFGLVSLFAITVFIYIFCIYIGEKGVYQAFFFFYRTKPVYIMHLYFFASLIYIHSEIHEIVKISVKHNV